VPSGCPRARKVLYRRMKNFRNCAQFLSRSNKCSDECLPARLCKRRDPSLTRGFTVDLSMFACRGGEDMDARGDSTRRQSWWMCLLRAFVPQFDAIPCTIPYQTHEEAEYFTRAGSQGAVYCPMGAPLLCSTSPALTGKHLTLEMIWQDYFRGLTSACFSQYVLLHAYHF
jgi:hypothetical protein